MAHHHFEVERAFIHGGLPKLKKFMDAQFEEIQSQWKDSVNNSDVPNWWKRMVFRSGGKLKKKRTLNGFRIYYSDEGKYDYFGVIDKGRPRYDMKAVLWSRLPKHMGRNGAYVVVPLRGRGGLVSFRALKPTSTGWQYPAIKGSNIIQGINKKVREIYLSDEFKNTLREDLMKSGKNIFFQTMLKTQIMNQKRTRWRFW